MLKYLTTMLLYGEENFFGKERFVVGAYDLTSELNILFKNLNYKILE